MIIVEKTNNGFKSYSNQRLKIKPVLDRMGQSISEHAIYDEAEDIEIDGQPRFDYEETEEDIAKLNELEAQSEEIRQQTREIINTTDVGGNVE